jgi:hypothetical protein
MHAHWRHCASLTLACLPSPCCSGGAQVLSIGRDIACGLAYLHPAVLHRDLK